MKTLRGYETDWNVERPVLTTELVLCIIRGGGRAKVHKLKPGVPTELIPHVQVVEVWHLADADAKPDAVPLPPAEALLDDPADLPDQVLVLGGRGGG